MCCKSTISKRQQYLFRVAGPVLLILKPKHPALYSTHNQNQKLASMGFFILGFIAASILFGALFGRAAFRWWDRGYEIDDMDDVIIFTPDEPDNAQDDI